jgi:DNA repair exonuclease SbcCD nuclease subunit
MTAQPLRFIHAANLHLDCPLQDTGPLPDGLRTVVQSATLTAWDRIVEACLNRDVDFLLLSGNSFDEHDPGVRGQAALIAGCERLDATGIPVFIVPGQRDPASAWLPGLRLPKNVTLFDRPGVETVEIGGDHSRLATLHGVNDFGARAGFEWATWPDATPAALRSRAADIAPHIALLPCGLSDIDAGDRLTLTRDRLANLVAQRGTAASIRYWACGDNARRCTLPIRDAVAHAPGTPQGLTPAETGPRGATLVEIEASGAVRLDLIPTPPVRWESCSLTLDHSTTRDDLLISMQSALRDIPHHDSDRLWLVHWTITLPPAVREQLADDDLEKSLSDELLASSGMDGGPRGCPAWSRRFRWRETASRVEAEPAASGVAAPLELHAERDIALATEFRRFVAALESQPQWMPRRLEESTLNGSPWNSRLAQFVSELDEADIAVHVRQLGEELFR